MVDLGPNCSKIRDTPVPSSNDDRKEKIGYTSTKKHLHPRTEEEIFSLNENNGGDDQDTAEFARKKRAKKNNSETGADSSSSLSDYSCFVALVTASNLQKDELYLPQDFTSSNGIKRECCEIVLTDEGERSWPLDLRFNKLSETFYISGGWRCFCNENGKKAGGFFMFKLVGNGEILVLSFCPTEPGNNRKQRKCSEASGRDSAPSSQKQFVTLTIRRSTVLHGSRLRLPIKFTRENDINMPGMITLLGKDRIKQQTELLFHKRSGAMCLGNGWKDFVKANGLKTGDSFTLKLTWEDTAPVLTLCPADCRDSTSPSKNRFVKLTLTHDSLKRCRLRLPSSFARENGLIRPGTITLLGKDGTKWLANFLQDSRGTMSLGNGLKDFAEANGLKIGVSFTLESIWENAIPMLSLYSIESTSDRRRQGERSKASSGNKTKKAKNNREDSRDLSSPSQDRFVTLTLTRDSLKRCRLHLPSSFVRENGITRPGMITLLGKNGEKWLAKLLQDYRGTMSLGSGWKDFVEATGLKIGESFTFESIWKNVTPILSLFSRDSTSEKMQEGECSKSSEKESKSTEPNSENKTKNNREDRRDSSEDVRDC